MKCFSSLSFWVVVPLLAVFSFAQPPPSPQEKTLTGETGASGKAADDDTTRKGNTTTFNDLEVPPMKDLTTDGIDTQIKDGYWFIKHYSPYCGHCIDIAPTWQTLYEFYYTSSPLPGRGSSDMDTLNSFTRYYDFNFASLDCIAYGDACAAHDVQAFPTFALYKSGKLVKKFTDAKKIENISKFIEEQLEAIRPGSRPRAGIQVPAPGATHANMTAEPSTPEAKDKNPDAGAAAAALHMSAAVAAATTGLDAQVTKAVTSTTKTVGSPAIPNKKLSSPANPIGTSVALTHESFQKLVINTRDPWFIKFYTPWCPHCQALAPSWLQMAKELQGKLNIGEVNCDRESRLCKDVRAKAYPTIHFFRGGERVEYDGLRGLGDLVNFAKKALAVEAGVQDVDAASFKTMELTEEVIFVYFYDHATASEDFQALDRLTLSLVGHARLVKTNDTALFDRFKISNWPHIMVSRDGRADHYEALAPRDTRDYRQVLTWMQKVWLPIVPELTVSNSREIFRGKYVVLGILNRDRPEEFLLDKREIKNAALDWMDKQRHAFELERQELRDAKKLRLEEAEDRNDDRAKRAAKSIRIDIREDDKKQVGFAWVDGIFWERWIKTTYGINVKDGERVIINDEDNHRFWENTISGAWITPSRTSIMETIPKVIANPAKIPSKSTTGFFQRIFYFVTGMVSSHPYLSIILLSACGALVWTQYVSGKLGGGRGHGNRRRGISLGGIERGLGGKNSGSNGGWIGGAEKLIGGLLDEKDRGAAGNGKAD